MVRSAPPFTDGDAFDWWFLSLLAWCQIEDNSPLASFLVEGFEATETAVWQDASFVLPGFCVFVGATTVLIGVEGTTGASLLSPQWLANILGSVQANLPPIPGAVSTYFGSAASALGALILPIIGPYLSTRRVVFTGHSLGGAIAQILFATLAPLCLAGANCMVLGSPRVGNPVFATAVSNARRLAVDGDCVPGLPPIVWAASTNTYPIPGAPPFAIYQHGGQGQTLFEDGHVDDSDNPPSTAQVLQILLDGSWPVHFTSSYAGRLAAGLGRQIGGARSLLSPGDGYADPKRLDSVYSELSGVPIGGEEMATGRWKVTSFFSLKNRGYTYSYYSGQTDQGVRAGDLKAWLNGILDLSCPQVLYLYTRYSNLDVKRQVNWDTDTSLGVNPKGRYNANVAPEDDALFIRGTLVGNGRAEQFFHGYPDLLVQNETLNLLGQPWYTKFLQFAAYLISQGSAYQFKNVNQTAVHDPVTITTATPGAYRGFTIVAPMPDAINKGDVVRISRVKRTQCDGFQGRKIVTSVQPGIGFNVGGAIPFGELNADATYTLLPPVFAALTDWRIERYSEHRLGRPFGLRPGRDPNRIPLRR